MAIATVLRIFIDTLTDVSSEEVVVGVSISVDLVAERHQSPQWRVQLWVDRDSEQRIN